jgi:glycosyltransferase involved in cell wall biosynthesis
LSTLFLFTDKFPFKGGEPFLETEIVYLSKAFEEVIIFPLSGQGSEKLPMPPNVEVIDFETNRPVYIKKLLIKHGWIIVKWFVLEFIKSPHRFKYITQFNWNFKRLAGLLNNAIELNNFINHLNLSKPHQPLYYSYWFNDWASMLAIAKDKGLDKKLISRVHLYDFEEEFSGRKYLPFRYVEQTKIDKIFPISNYAIRYIARKSNKVKMELSRLGVSDRGDNLISNNENRFRIVTCSSLSWYKRPLLLMELMIELKCSIEWVHFGDGVLREEFLSLAEELPQNIQFSFKGHLANSEVINFYQNNAVDLVLNVSSFEGIPVSLMEAISFGIPIVGCNMCGMPEIINSKTGMLLEVDFNITEVAMALESFLKTNSRNQSFRNGVKEFWKDNFDADKNYKDFVEDLKAT